MKALRTGFIAAAATFMAGAALAQTGQTGSAGAAPSSASQAPAAGASSAGQGPSQGANPSSAAPAASGWSAIRPAGDIYTTLQASGQFTAFLKAMDTANLTPVLKQPGNLTVFAPTDAALAAASPAETQALTAVASARPILTYHLVNTRLDAAKVAGAKGPIPTVAGRNVVVDGTAQPMRVNDAPVLQGNVLASNGIIYVVGKVLDPNYTPPPEPTEATSDTAGAPK